MAVMVPAGFTLTEVVSGQSPPASSLPPLLGGFCSRAKASFPVSYGPPVAGGAQLNEQQSESYGENGIALPRSLGCKWPK